MPDHFADNPNLTERHSVASSKHADVVPTRDGCRTGSGEGLDISRS